MPAKEPKTVSRDNQKNSKKSAAAAGKAYAEE